MRDKHPKDLERLSEDTNQSTSTTNATPTSLLFSKKAMQVFGWIYLVVGGLLLFSVVENVTYRRHIRYDPITRKTLAKYLEKLTSRVEQRISEKLPSKFAIVFDGWSTGDAHYVACFASFESNSKFGFSMILLGFSPFEDELSQDAEHHYKYLEFFLELFG